MLPTYTSRHLIATESRPPPPLPYGDPFYVSAQWSFFCVTCCGIYALFKPSTRAKLATESPAPTHVRKAPRNLLIQRPTGRVQRTFRRSHRRLPPGPPRPHRRSAKNEEGRRSPGPMHSRFHTPLLPSTIPRARGWPEVLGPPPRARPKPQCNFVIGALGRCLDGNGCPRFPKGHSVSDPLTRCGTWHWGPNHRDGRGRKPFHGSIPIAMCLSVPYILMLGARPAQFFFWGLVGDGLPPMAVVKTIKSRRVPQGSSGESVHPLSTPRRKGSPCPPAALLLDPPPCHRNRARV